MKKGGKGIQWTFENGNFPTQPVLPNLFSLLTYFKHDFVDDVLICNKITWKERKKERRKERGKETAILHWGSLG